MATYYISQSGNDTNSGTNPVSPFRTLAKAFAVATGEDTVLLRNSETFFGQLTPPATSQFTIGGYGGPGKPTVSALRTVVNSAWVNHSSNIWKVNITNPANWTGDVIADTNVGFVVVNGRIQGYKKFSLAELTTQWSFYSDSTYLYVYSQGNPGSIYSPTVIEFAPNIKLLALKQNLEVYDIALDGTGGHGVQGGLSSLQNVILSGLDISRIGGSQLGQGSRYGNGIEIYGGGKNIEIQGCTIDDCYDAAFTMQGMGTYADWIDIAFSNNILRNNNQSLEFWTDPDPTTQKKAGFYNCLIENNQCYNAGLGWSWPVRPDKETGVHILTYGWYPSSEDITIQNNVFYRAKNGLYAAMPNTPLPGYISRNNYIFLEKGQAIRSQSSTAINQFKNFQTATGKESDSDFYELDSPESILASTDSIKNMNNLVATAGLAQAQNRMLGKIIGSALSGSKRVAQRAFLPTPVPVSTASTTGYVTQLSTSGTDAWAKLATVKISGQYTRLDATINYMICGDSVSPRGGIGTINLQVSPNNDLTAAAVELRLVESLAFVYGYTASDFVLVTEVADGNQVVAGLYFNVGRKNYARLQYKPSLVYSDSTSNDVLIFSNKASLLPSLPPGSQVVGTH